MFSIPTWALPLLLTLVVAVLGFAYRLATRAERLTDKLETLAGRMGAYEARRATTRSRTPRRTPPTPYTRTGWAYGAPKQRRTDTPQGLSGLSGQEVKSEH